MSFSYHPPLSKKVVKKGVKLDVSQCKKIPLELRKFIDSVFADYPMQTIIGASAEEIMSVVGCKMEEGQHCIYHVFGGGNEVINDPHGMTLLTVVHDGHGRRPVLSPGIMNHKASDEESIILSDEFQEQQKRIMKNNKHYVDSNGNVHYTESPSRPIGSVYSFSRNKNYHSKIESVVTKHVKKYMDIEKPDNSLDNPVLAVQVGFFTYSNSKWGFRAKDTKQSHRICPDILIKKPQKNGRRLCIEIDGVPHRMSFADDRERTRCLKAAGWDVIRIRMDNMNPVTPYDIVVNETNKITYDILDELIEKIAIFYPEVKENKEK